MRLRIKSYRGAGILFFVIGGNGQIEILLAQRRSGIWSIPGGGKSTADVDLWATARRETREEFGEIPAETEKWFDVTYPFAPVFSWRTFVVRLPCKPGMDKFPNIMARDFRHEFSTAAWFNTAKLPRKTHLLIYPVIWKLHRWPR